MFYKVIVECGHLGANNACEITRFIEESSIVEALSSLRSMPRVKSKGSLKSVKFLQEITREEYLQGIKNFKKRFEDSPYFNAVRKKKIN